MEDHLKPADLQAFHSHLQQASIVMLDANLCPETLEVGLITHKADLQQQLPKD